MFSCIIDPPPSLFPYSECKAQCCCESTRRRLWRRWAMPSTDSCFTDRLTYYCLKLSSIITECIRRALRCTVRVSGRSLWLSVTRVVAVQCVWCIDRQRSCDQELLRVCQVPHGHDHARRADSTQPSQRVAWHCIEPSIGCKNHARLRKARAVCIFHVGHGQRRPRVYPPEHVCIYIYIYVYIRIHFIFSLSLSLSLYIYIYNNNNNNSHDDNNITRGRPALRRLWELREGLVEPGATTIYEREGSYNMILCGLASDRAPLGQREAAASEASRQNNSSNDSSSNNSTSSNSNTHS